MPLSKTRPYVKWIFTLIVSITASSNAQHIASLGRIEPGERVLQIAAPAGSIVNELRVRRGEKIEAGHVLATLRDTPIYQAKVAYAEQRLMMAQTEWKIMESGERPEAVRAQEALIAALEAEMRLINIRSERYGSLLQKSHISQDSFDEIASQQGVIDARIQRERSILESLRSGRVEDVHKAEIAVRLAQAQLEEAQAALALQQIRSPIHATVLDIHAWPGESVGEDGALVSLGDTDNMMVLAEVYESDVPRLQIGQRATFRGQAFEGELEGYVKEIQPYFEKSRIFSIDPADHADRRILIVRIQPDDPARLSSLSRAHVIVTIKEP